jgi:hypothetical protein
MTPTINTAIQLAEKGGQASMTATMTALKKGGQPFQRVVNPL